MKRITSLNLGISFLIMSYTGIILFIAPHGRVAYWSDWHLLGLTKTDYGNIHTTAMVLFLVFGFLHIYYNWKLIIKYLRNKQKKISFTKKEFLIALILNLVFFLGTLFAIQPFQGFIDMGERIKTNWTKTYGEPPYGHAEETKLKIFCKKQKLDLNKAKENLKAKSIRFKDNESLKMIAKNSNLSPNDIYKIISKDNKKSNIKIKMDKNGIKTGVKSKEVIKDEDTPSKLGRRTLKELAKMKKIDLDDTLKILKKRGISDVTIDNKLKNLADELEITPLEIYQLINKVVK
jgi:hypothetical protein